MGGDEFIILLTDVGSVEEATYVMDRAGQAVQQTIEHAGQTFEIGLSSGLALAEPGDTADLLLRNADVALYAAKDAGRGRCQIYNAALRRRGAAQRSLEADLRTAVTRDEFELHYQPIVDLTRDEEVVAYEALVRWRHPSQGLLLPGAFIELAEESGVILDLGAVVLRHACRFLSEHPDASWQVIVNVSPLQLGRGLAQIVARELAAAGVAPSRLAIEITENGVLNASGSSLAEMTQLRSLGVDVLMDDFGTGYSALSSVMTTPITGLKLDHTFTTALSHSGPAARIASTVADLAQSLCLMGVAEGVETREQAEILVSHGWRYAQGYLFGRPVPAHLLVADLVGVWTDLLEPIGT